LDAYLIVPRIRWDHADCKVASGNTAFALSGRPLSPSQTGKNTSRTPRFLSSVRTSSQTLARLRGSRPTFLIALSSEPTSAAVTVVIGLPPISMIGVPGRINRHAA
jgi:hypothetical protein